MKNIFYATILLLLLCESGFTQSGTLDNRFSKNGKAFYDEFTGDCTAVKVQKDGKIVTGGYNDAVNNDKAGFLIARFNEDGSLDESFGDGGKVIISNVEGNYAYTLTALVIQDDGKIIASGEFINPSQYYDIGVIRLNTNGILDSSFSGNGIATISLGLQDDIVGDMALQPDGKIIITGKKGASHDGEATAIYLLRYLTDGNLDKSFGEKGIVYSDIGIYLSEINSIVLQTDNKILIGGRYKSGELVLIRYLPDGDIDLTFDENKDGIAGILLGDHDYPNSHIYDLAVQTDGKIVASGTAGKYNYQMAVIRFNSDGSIDSAFGDKPGYSVLTMETGNGKAFKVDITSDKKIILAGDYYTGYGTGTGFGAARYNVDGSLDSTFGENGVAIAGFNEIDAAGFAGIVQDDGKIIVGGSGYLPDDNDFTRIALVRFNNTITPTPPDFAKIQKWQGHYGFSWDDWSGNKTTYYSVGRSTNASTFTEIAQVQDVKGIKNYKYQDPAPPAGIVYYQLTAYRTDDKVVSSNIVTCGDDVPNNFIKLYPNPAKNSLRIEGLSKIEKTKLTVIDLSGNIKVSAIATADSYTLNIATLKPGNYMLRIESNGNMVSRMFVKE